MVHVSVVNLDPQRSADVRLTLRGAPVKAVSGRTLTAPSISALNDFGVPPAVQPAAAQGIQIQGGQVSVALPSKSVTVLAIQ